MPEVVWVLDPSWRLLGKDSQKRCYMGQGSLRHYCAQRAVAELRRKRADRDYWRAYCKEHLYGCRVANGRVEMQVAAPL